MDLIKISKEGFKAFALEANTRSTLNVHDGLKPVHRRILFSMSELGAVHNKDYKGSAKIVGEVLGSLHPHGDSSVYDAAVRMAQPFKMRYPLIDFNGNMGSILDSDSFAAMRYTKMRLTPLGEYILNGVNKNAVEMTENYNGECMEPVELPGAFPNVLLNGGMGIGVGLSSSLMPHQLGETCNAIQAYIKNRNITLDQLMEHIKGPDFPTGGVIVESHKLYDIYATGKGTIKLRAKYHIETIGGRTVIAVTEVPYLINVEDKIIDAIKKFVEEENYEDIYDVQNATGKDGLSIKIILEKGVNVNKVLKKLFESTGLEVTIKINNTILKDNQFKTLSLKELISEYVHHQHKVIINITKFDLEKAEAKLHILKGLIIALENIDEVVQIIKKSSNKDMARKNLMERFKSLSIIQTNAILDMKLSKLTSLEVQDLKDEINSLEKDITKMIGIINESSLRDDIIFSQLENFKLKYNDERRTTIASSEITQTTGKEVYIVLMDDQNIAALDKTVVSTSSKGRVGTLVNKNSIIDILFTNTKETIFGISKNGKMYPIPVSLIEVIENNKMKGSSLREIIDYDDEIIKLIKIDLNSDYLITVTKNGVAKKSNLSDYNFSKTAQAAKIREDDELVTVLCAKEEDNLVILGTGDKIVNFPISELRNAGKHTIGSKCMTTNSVINAVILNKESKLLSWNNNNQGKITSFDEIPNSPKGGAGVNTSEDCTGLLKICGEMLVMVLDKDGKAIVFNISEIGEKGFKTSGSELKQGKIDKIITL